MTGRCPECGFDGSGLSPTDAVVALRSFPRRFAALTDPQSDDEDRPEVDPARVDAEATAAAAGIAAAGAAMRRVLIEQDPVLAEAPAPATLEEATASVAALAESTSGRDWARTGTRQGQVVTALDLLREAVHAGAHHLRLAGD